MGAGKLASLTISSWVGRAQQEWNSHLYSRLTQTCANGIHSPQTHRPALPALHLRPAPLLSERRPLGRRGSMDSLPSVTSATCLPLLGMVRGVPLGNRSECLFVSLEEEEVGVGRGMVRRRVKAASAGVLSSESRSNLLTEHQSVISWPCMTDRSLGRVR
jgi:hypothetical protein